MSCLTIDYITILEFSLIWYTMTYAFVNRPAKYKP